MASELFVPLLQPTLSFQSLNPTGTPTLLFLHGTFTSHHGFRLLLSQPQFEGYHLLIPDLPFHGHSHPNIHFCLPAITTLLAELITTQAHHSRAHILGDDFGGYVALSLASSYPSLIESVFAVGCEKDYSSFLSTVWVAFKTYFGAVLGFRCLPKSWLRWVLERLDSEMNEELERDMRACLSWRYVWGLFRCLRLDWGSGKGVCERVGVRTLVVACGRQDDVDGARERGFWLRGGLGRGVGSKAVVVRGARHAWCLQRGMIGVFAEGIAAWVEGKPLPMEFDMLQD